MSKPRGQKAPRRCSVTGGFELPATRICVAAGATLMLQFIAIAPAKAATQVCANDTHAAIETARDALAKGDRDEDRAALECLIEAVAALDERIQGLASGSMPFEGQIYAPKGVAMTKPSDLEGR